MTKKLAMTQRCITENEDLPSLIVLLSFFYPAVRAIRADSAPTKDDECHSVEPGADVGQHPQEEAKLKADGILKLLSMRSLNPTVHRH